MTATWKNEEGQSRVELALCLPILLTIVLGILTFGIALTQTSSGTSHSPG